MAAIQRILQIYTHLLRGDLGVQSWEKSCDWVCLQDCEFLRPYPTRGTTALPTSSPDFPLHWNCSIVKVPPAVAKKILFRYPFIQKVILLRLPFIQKVILSRVLFYSKKLYNYDSPRPQKALLLRLPLHTKAFVLRFSLHAYKKLNADYRVTNHHPRSRTVSLLIV